MEQLNKSTMTLKFEVGRVDETSMGITVKSTLHQGTYDNLGEDFSVTFPVEFPSQVIIETFGKGPHDTKVDADGKVIADKYLKLTDILIDQLSVARYYCDQKVVIDNGNQKITTSYWGYNGTVIIELDEENGFRWLAKTQNYV